MRLALPAVIIAGAAAVTCVTAPSAMAMQQAVISSDNTDAQMWYQQFTLSAETGEDLNLDQTEYEVEGGDSWGFTLGVDDREDQRFNWDAIEAGAYFNLGERFRFQGTVRFSNPDTLIYGQPSDESEPEVRFESGVRF